MKRRKGSLYDIRDIWAIAWKRKWLILIPLVIVGSITYGVSFLITPAYESSTIISIDEQVPFTTELQRLLGTEQDYRRIDRRDELRGYYNMITSSRYLGQLVDQLDLDEDPALDHEARQMASSQDPAMIAQVKFDLLQDKLRDKITVSFAARQQLRIAAESTSPALARDIANTLADIFIKERISQELTSIRSSQDFSDIQLQKYEKQLEDKINERTQLEQRLMRIQLDESITSEANRLQISAEIDRSNNEIEEYRRQERDIVAALATDFGIPGSNLSLKPPPRSTMSTKRSCAGRSGAPPTRSASTPGPIRKSSTTSCARTTSSRTWSGRIWSRSTSNSAIRTSRPATSWRNCLTSAPTWTTCTPRSHT